MDKNGKVLVIPNSDDYRKGYDTIDWDNKPVDRVVIYDPFIDGPIEELLPKPVSMKFEGGAGPVSALTFTFPVEE